MSTAATLSPSVTIVQRAYCNGVPAEYGAVHVFSVVDGQISGFHEYTDLDAALA